MGQWGQRGQRVKGGPQAAEAVSGNDNRSEESSTTLPLSIVFSQTHFDVSPRTTCRCLSGTRAGGPTRRPDPEKTTLGKGQGSGFRGSEFRVHGSWVQGFRVQSSEFRGSGVQGQGFRFQVSVVRGFRVQLTPVMWRLVSPSVTAVSS